MSSSSVLPLTTALPSIHTQVQAFKTQPNQTHGFRVISCNGAPEDHQLILPQTQKLIVSKLDRRNMLLGLGGLYTATNLPAASADPITSPDITKNCQEASLGLPDPGNPARTRNCCPPTLGKTIKPFKFPKEKEVRMRWPAHKGTKDQVAKFKKAMKAMRELPEDHPHSFNSQAKIHCAYCNGGYTQVDNGFPEIDIQIHNNWLFFPFHRWYVYFYERILGKLINDPTFALPYWNWDDPEGMVMPEIVLQLSEPDSNPLFDVNRNVKHLPPAIVDLAYGGSDRGSSGEKQIECNLSTVYRDLVRNGGDTLSFFGGVYVAGDAPVGMDAMSVGSVEASSHGAMHRWVGNPELPNNEDMGNFYSSGYDPLFYIHHTNVDRMWKLWTDLHIPGHVEPTDPEWLNASFVFYDENEELVRVYNKDSVNINKLRYDYQKAPNYVFPWRNSRPAKRSKSLQVDSIAEEVIKTLDKEKFPMTLDKIRKVRVKRPAVGKRPQHNEILLIYGIKYDSDKFVKFDVFVNDKLKEGVEATPCDPEYAGCFTQLPHKEPKKMKMTTAARFGLTELLEDTNTQGEEYVTVTLVPRAGHQDLTIGGITIQLIPLSPLI